MSVFHKEKGWASSTGTVRRRLRFARRSGSAGTPAASGAGALVSRRVTEPRLKGAVFRCVLAATTRLDHRSLQSRLRHTSAP
jgi:hypothetical protein